MASQFGHSEVVDVLVQNGADINQQMSVGRKTHSVFIPLTWVGTTPSFKMLKD